MLGILGSLFGLGVLTYGSIKDSDSDNKSRSKALQEGKRDYIDHQGHIRDVHSNHKILYWTDNNHNTTRYDLDNHTEINITMENDAKKAKENGYSTVRLGLDDHYKDPCQGVRFKDINTGDIYVIRTWNGIYFYMNILTSKFVRFTDSYVKGETDEKLEQARKKVESAMEFYFYDDRYYNHMKTNCNIN